LIKKSSDSESWELMRRIKMGGRVEDVLRRAREAELLVQLNPNARPEEVRVQYTLPSLASMVLKGRMLMPDTR
jgi:hypothetical protein